MAYTVFYEQEWHDGSRSWHRNPSDILEFARNQEPVPTRFGMHRERRTDDPTHLTKIKNSGLGIWVKQY
jgi:hypothetical protein